MLNGTTPWHNRIWAVIAALVIFWPLGVFLLWKLNQPSIRKGQKWGIFAGAVVVWIIELAMIGALMGEDEGTEANAAQARATATTTADAALTPTTPTPERTATPEVTVTAEATPTPEPTPTPVPTPRPSIYKLALISGKCTLQSDIGFTECEGFVENISGKTMENVEVVITWVDADGIPQSSDEALIDYNPILAGQQSPWSTIGTYNPALTKFRVQFKELLGGTIPTRDDRPQ